MKKAEMKDHRLSGLTAKNEPRRDVVPRFIPAIIIRSIKP